MENLILEPQTYISYRLNPNEQELNGEVNFDRNVDGRIFSSCTLEIKDHTAILIDEGGTTRAVLSLHHFYLINHIK
jgi:hypothetical protein